MSYSKQVMIQAVHGLGLKNIFQSLRHEIITRLNTLKSNMLNTLGEIEALRDSIMADDTETEVTQSETTALLKMATVSLPDKKEAYLRAKQDYFAFRALHNMTREVIITDKTIFFLSLLLMVFLEAGINVPFIINAHLTAGTTSALLFAVLISFTNVLLSTLLGYLGRWKNYGLDSRDPSLFTSIRFKARLAFWGGVVLIIWLLLLVGMVRVQGTVDSLQHGLSAYLDVFSTPESFFLVVTGACMSIISYMKGLSFDDSYPGLAERYRMMMEKQAVVLQDWREDFSDINEQFNETIEDKKDALKAQKNTISQHTQRVNQFHHDKRLLEEAIETEKSQLQAQIEDMVNDYKAARGEDYSLSETDIEKLTHFEHLLADIRTPTALKKPDGLHQAIRKLEDSKYAILDQYNQLLDEIFKSYQGEKS